MKKSKFWNLIFIIPLSIIFSCSKTTDIKDYSERLQINFPTNMDLIFYDIQSDFQDYSVTSIYKLTFNQKNTLLNEVIKNLHDSKEEKKHGLQWHKCNDYYTYEYENKEEGVYISLIFVSKNNLSTLSILEMKI